MSLKFHILISTCISLALIILISFYYIIKFDIKIFNSRKVNINNDFVSSQNLKVPNTNLFLNNKLNKSNLINIATNEILLNRDFSEGFKNWSHDKNVIIVNDNGTNIVEFIGNNKFQTRIWQTVNILSGHTYRLSFNLKADNDGALAFVRDNLKNKESYFMPRASKIWKRHEKNYIFYRTGLYDLYLSCNSEGKFCFSDISFFDVTEKNYLDNNLENNHNNN